MSKRDSIYLVLDSRMKRAVRAAAAQRGLTVAAYIIGLIEVACRANGADAFVNREKVEVHHEE